MSEAAVTRIEPDARLVVLARTLQARDPTPDPRPGAARSGGAPGASFDGACLGRALYRHRSVFQSASDAPAWSHLDIHYFRDLVPAEAVHDLVLAPQPAGVRPLRAEILLTTPASFALPQGRRGPAGRPGRVASLEYIHVRPDRLGDYRAVMRRYVGPAAARLVAAGTFGTYRAMETAAVLHRDPAFDVDWNQIHLCGGEAEGFEGFAQAFDAALGAVAPEGGYAEVFAGLGAMRTIPRWTFNDVVVEADDAIGGMESPAADRG